MKIWSCKIGEIEDVPYGADSPMRQAVQKAYFDLVGKEPDFIFSGWGATLTDSERAVARNEPASEKCAKKLSTKKMHLPEWIECSDFGKVMQAVLDGALAKRIGWAEPTFFIRLNGTSGRVEWCHGQEYCPTAQDVVSSNWLILGEPCPSCGTFRA